MPSSDQPILPHDPRRQPERQDVLALMAFGENSAGAMAEHVQGCAICTTELLSLQHTVHLAKGIAPKDDLAAGPSPAVWDRIAAELVVRHVAAAPAVDVRANGKVAFSKLTNPNQAMADLPAGTVSADVVLAGTDTVAIGPADVTLAAGTETTVYAIGSAESKDLALVVQKIDGLGAAPGGMPAGTGGLADPHTSGLPMLAWAAIIAGALLVLGGAAAGTMRIRRQQ